jgi:undecaprenyl diphosphate synthase
MRLSNFLLWQSAYAELIFLDDFWPDMRRAKLWSAVLDYQKRIRRFGSAENDPEISPPLNS